MYDVIEYLNCGDFLGSPFTFVEKLFSSILDGVGGWIKKSLLNSITNVINDLINKAETIYEFIFTWAEYIFDFINTFLKWTKITITDLIFDTKKNIDTKINILDNNANSKIDNTHNYFIDNIKRVFGIESPLNVVIMKFIVVAIVYCIFAIIVYIIKMFYNNTLIWHSRHFTFISNKIAV